MRIKMGAQDLKMKGVVAPCDIADHCRAVPIRYFRSKSYKMSAAQEE